MSRHIKIESRCLLASAAIAVATMLSAASPVFAADAPAAAATAPQDAAKCAPSDNEPQTGTRIRRDCKATDLDTVMVFGGAELRPGDSQWADNDTSAPELPMTRDHDTSKR
jgi:hypothetical protein